MLFCNWTICPMLLTETKNKYIKEEKIVLYDITKTKEQRKF